MNQFSWIGYNRLDHKFTQKYKNNVGSDVYGWFECLICNVKVYTNIAHGNKLMYCDFDPFHNNYFGNNTMKPVVEFNLSCEEVIIKKIIE